MELGGRYVPWTFREHIQFVFCPRPIKALEVARMSRIQSLDLPISKRKLLRNLLLVAKVVTLKQNFKSLKVVHINLTLETLWNSSPAGKIREEWLTWKLQIPNVLLKSREHEKMKLSYFLYRRSRRCQRIVWVCLNILRG